jgi:hypothetical protein
LARPLHQPASRSPGLTGVLASISEEVGMLGFGMVLLGLVTFAAIFGFVALCDRV